MTRKRLFVMSEAFEKHHFNVVMKNLNQIHRQKARMFS
jgi:hypothetical protein